MNVDKGGLLLLQRYVPEQRPLSGISAEDVAVRYRGFDGISWPGELLRDVPLQEGLAPMAALPDLLAYWRGLDDKAYDLLYCSFGEDVDLPAFEFVGFDVGYYESEFLHFSVVLNEIVCGTTVELVELTETLNQNLLFSSALDAEGVVRLRDKLLKAGADLETGDEVMDVVEIFGVRRDGPKRWGRSFVHRNDAR